MFLKNIKIKKTPIKTPLWAHSVLGFFSSPRHLLRHLACVAASSSSRSPAPWPAEAADQLLLSSDAGSLVIAISSSATCVTNREVGRRPELLNTDANRRQDARRARGAAGGPGRGLCLGIRTATSSPISHPVRC